MQHGLIIRSTGSWYDIRAIDGHVYQGRLKGKFKIKGLKVTNPIAVGDKVTFEVEDEAENTALITDISPRENYIIRQSVHKTAHGHILAANLDQAVLLATLTLPRTSLGFIDRFLVSAESFRIPTTLVFNKTDILNDDGLAYQQEIMDMYEQIGYQCLATSATEGEGVDAFRQLLDHKVTLLSGHSGVGKSSLVNAIAPNLNLRTNEVSTFANKGVHTTTFAEMFELAPDTFIIDTPGIKELGLIDTEKEEISHYFPEMRDRLNQCRFHNCLHINEPGCSIKDAVAEGEIAESRYLSYLSMMDGSDNRR
ncbi:MULTISPECIES: ribosome small subunit-dependent GTPase A [unclassified Spirosoma]|uniref:ribosome small subunit-dependent GTPase A n=1 Tax=unclassified Spirosoma TaxID=2621999 RepID=UPI00095CB56E|nr:MULTISPECIES: ribosome small subunit-dependent GTPase A [unclassified Spirosoma]MBN8824590.1 ribosome small subunit-dependent GTPase A [Spirosoma sp.]OJW70951.1 MAG: ribosome small subunit-dependent GTPase A [Spirosoma sp. 48-14]